MNRLPPHIDLRAVVTAVVVVAAATACLSSCGVAPGPTPGATTAPATGHASTARLHLLVGSPGAMRFASVAIDGGPAATTSAAPGAVASLGPGLSSSDLRWASGDTASGYVITVGDRGRLYANGPASARSDPFWREVVPRDANGARVTGTPSFAVLSPDGRRIAALTGQPATGVADARLLVIDRSPTGSTRVVTLGGIVDGSPPAWIGDTRVAVPLRDRSDAHVLALVEASTGTVVRSPGPAGCLAASADGSTVAVTDPADIGTVAAGAAAAFLSGGSLDRVPLDARSGPAPRLAAQVLLDRTGATMAVVWLNDAGDAASVGIYRRAAKHWAESQELPMAADDTRAVLVGFDP